MTDLQIFTMAIAVIVPLSLLLYSNSRISDVKTSIGDAKETLRAEMKTNTASIQEAKETLRAEIQEIRGTLRAEMKADKAEILAEFRTGFLRIENKLDHVIETQADHGSRLEKLEGKI